MFSHFRSSDEAAVFQSRPPVSAQRWPWTRLRTRIDNAMVKAIAPAFRWREMLENGTHATIAEIAAAEKINEPYVGRFPRLTLPAPDLVEAIVGGQQPAEMTLG
jgi:hypothetical protein